MDGNCISRRICLRHSKACEASEWAVRELTHRKGQCVAAIDGGHVEDLAGLALEGQVEAELRQERLQRSTQLSVLTQILCHSMHAGVLMVGHLLCANHMAG